MKFELQENEINLLRLGESRAEGGVVKREIFFEVKGKEFSREVILGPNATGADYDDVSNFYRMNKEMVEASLIQFLSENHLYDNLDSDKADSAL